MGMIKVAKKSLYISKGMLWAQGCGNIRKKRQGHKSLFESER
jgi:hypothetical protein